MLAYERFGSGEPLVLIHGIGHRRQTWYPVVDRLAQEFDVIIPDLPGHGGSTDQLDLSVPAKDALRDAFQDFFAHLGIERPHVAGNSLGGLIALELAEEDLARSVTALSPAGFWGGPRDYTYVRALFGSVLTAARIARPVAGPLAHSVTGRMALMGWLYAQPQNVAPEMVVGDLENMLHARPVVKHLLRQAYTFAPGDPRDIPVTIAWAEKDKVLLPYHAGHARRLMPHATHVWLDHCGHVPMSDDPDLVADTILGATRGAAAAVTEPVEPAGSTVLRSIA